VNVAGIRKDMYRINDFPQRRTINRP